MSGPLEDIVVVDLTQEAWASGAAGLLGDFGARVIRIHDVSGSPRDPARDGLRADEPFDSEAELIHRNKESVALDLAQAEGLDLLKTLIGCADVLVPGSPAVALAAIDRGRGFGNGALGAGIGPPGPG